jgi:hypothetical protein
LARAPEHGGHQERHGQIELLLDGERPEVQQHIALRIRRKIPRLLPEKDVVDRKERRKRRPAEFEKVVRDHRGGADDERHQYDDQHRRPDAEDAPLEEAPGVEDVLLDLAGDDLRHQESGDDEEDVDPDETSRSPSYVEVIEDDGRHRDRTQALDVGAKVRGRLPGGYGRRGCRVLH